MPPETLPTPSITITKAVARRFILTYHKLFPPRHLRGKDGILDFVNLVGCIQFDPINIVGRNPDLVLQSRVKDYRAGLLDALLYTDRKLLDGWDKMAAIYPIEDHPNFQYYRYWLRNQTNSRRPPEETIQEVLEEVRGRGPLSSLDFDGSEKVDWFWGPTKVARAALEHLYSWGYLGINHRVNNRRAFDLIERLIPAEILEQPDPFRNEEAYQDWHVTRRVGSMGLAHAKSGEYWYGILGVKSRERAAILRRLTDNGTLLAIGIDELPQQLFFIRQTDYPTLEAVRISDESKSEAAIIAALDNLTWNRGLIQQVFDFEYVWEVYKPKEQRKYGYYVLPILYGDCFVARFEPAYDKNKATLTIQNWWWENGINPDTTMLAALKVCMHDFMNYLEADHLQLGEPTLAAQLPDFDM
jgi:uncharacterized protein YcaQ